MRLKALKGRHVSLKSPSTVHDRLKFKLLEGAKGNKRLKIEGSLICHPDSSIIFTKIKQKKWVSGQTWCLVGTQRRFLAWLRWHFPEGRWFQGCRGHRRRRSCPPTESDSGSGRWAWGAWGIWMGLRCPQWCGWFDSRPTKSPPKEARHWITACPFEWIQLLRERWSCAEGRAFSIWAGLGGTPFQGWGGCCGSGQASPKPDRTPIHRQRCSSLRSGTVTNSAKSSIHRANLVASKRQL